VFCVSCGEKLIQVEVSSFAAIQLLDSHLKLALQFGETRATYFLLHLKLAERR